MITALSNIGGRENNEDSYITKDLNGVHLIAVADGMGGHAAGEMASRLAIIELEAVVEELLAKGTAPDEILKKGYAKVNHEIRDLSKHDLKYQGMGTTLVSALVFDHEAIFANLGDSRGYLIRDDIKQITKDHSLVQELVDNGVITPVEAFGHPRKNILTKALGLEDEAEPDIYRCELDEGDVLMLCSDGLSDSLGDEEIKEIFEKKIDLDNAAEKLIETALGSKDNITFILYAI